MAHRSRRYRAALQTVDRTRAYPLAEAIAKVKSMPAVKFDETVECAVCLGIDPRHSDQQVRGTISLPHGTGTSRRVAVFAEGPNADAAREAGADVVGGQELIDQVNGGMLDFDVALATPDMMSRIGRLGRVLGPRGLMPSPKSGTVRADIGQAVKEFKAGMLEFRNDAGGNIHVPVGKRSFSEEQLRDNVAALLEQINRMKPPAAKGRFMRKVCIASTMGPGVLVEVSS
jgi:large subunit ribosomal protein L1